MYINETKMKMLAATLERLDDVWDEDISMNPPRSASPDISAVADRICAAVFETIDRRPLAELIQPSLVFCVRVRDCLNHIDPKYDGVDVNAVPIIGVVPSIAESKIRQILSESGITFWGSVEVSTVFTGYNLFYLVKLHRNKKSVEQDNKQDDAEIIACD